MNVVGIGIDLMQGERIRRVFGRHGDRFLHRIYTRRELDYCNAARDPYERLAARWAAKEATFKALGCPKSITRWTDIEVTHSDAGAPRVLLSGETGRWARDAGIAAIEISLSHSDGLAVASVMVLGQ